jgi:hypothetical protein
MAILGSIGKYAADACMLSVLYIFRYAQYGAHVQICRVWNTHTVCVYAEHGTTCWYADYRGTFGLCKYRILSIQKGTCMYKDTIC